MEVGKLDSHYVLKKQVYEIICIVKMKDEGRNSVAYLVESMKTHHVSLSRGIMCSCVVLLAFCVLQYHKKLSGGLLHCMEFRYNFRSTGGI